MPLEGTDTVNAQAADKAAASAATTAANTPDAAAQNTGAATNAGAGTQTAQTGAQTDITQSPEFKAALTAAIEAKIPQLKRSLAKSITGEKDKDGVDPNDLQRQLSETQEKLRSFEAKATIREHLSDPKHKLSVPADSLSGIEELVLARLEYGNDGKPSNLKDAIESVRSSFPRLFANSQTNINANNGRGQNPAPANMNDFIRQVHAGRN